VREHLPALIVAGGQLSVLPHRPTSRARSSRTGYRARVPGVKGQIQQRGVERRAMILAAARTVFSTHGYRGGSLARVSELAGVTPAGILHHIGSKERLLLAVLRARDEGFREGLLALGELPGLEMVRGMVAVAEVNERDRGLVAVAMQLKAEHLEIDGEVRDWFRERHKMVSDTYTIGLRQAQAAGEIDASLDAEALASEIIAFQEGAELQWLLRPELSLVELYRTYFDRLCETIGPR
jgi:AcrR family transcriptional regulator